MGEVINYHKDVGKTIVNKPFGNVYLPELVISGMFYGMVLATLHSS